MTELSNTVIDICYVFPVYINVEKSIKCNLTTHHLGFRKINCHFDSIYEKILELCEYATKDNTNKKRTDLKCKIKM